MKSLTRTFKVPNNTTTTLSIQIHDDVTVRAHNLNLETWGSSLVLARLLHTIHIPHLTTSMSSVQSHSYRRSSAARSPYCGPVIELGAGTGLVGISAAAIWRTNVTLTDLAPIAPALASNIALNEDLLSWSGGSAVSGALDWRHPSVLSLQPQNVQGLQDLPVEHNKAQVILAADTIYDPSHPEMLVEVIRLWLRPGPDSRVLIAYPVRVAYLEEIRELWERLEGIELELVEEGKEELPKKDWDDEVLIEWSIWKWKL